MQDMVPFSLLMTREKEVQVDLPGPNVHGLKSSIQVTESPRNKQNQ